MSRGREGGGARTPPHPAPVLTAFMYHEVSDGEASGFQRPLARSYTVSRRGFTAHLDRIAQRGRRPGLVTDAAFAAGEPLLALTFDDGGQSAAWAADRLAERGWRGHFFIVTGRIGRSGFVDAPALRRLADEGHLIGTHSHSHPDIFRELAPEDMDEEWIRSADSLAQLLGRPCEAGSIPGGDSSPRAVESAARAGLRYLFTSEPRRLPERWSGCWTLGRYAIRRTTSPDHLARLLEGRGWWRALAVRRVKDLSRRAAPGLYRWYVRQRTRETEPPARAPMEGDRDRVLAERRASDS